ncbi:YoaK family protein [Pseudomonas asiatica]|uniref:YoaK family protein n=1 Tax=Pseudomonas asiatica TaxID=2219225 RepID=UPI0010C00339|nr:YoaK family protein [Pseudomonas asiatica]WJN52781.1 YoaK family protein [Pseudomonas asiatica]
MLPNTLPARTAKRLRLQMLRGRVGLGLVAGLSVLAGMTDAIGLLALGDFVSFMSGNTTRLAVAISDADLALVLRLSAAVLGFVVGNALGVLLARAFRRRAWPVLLVVAALLGFAAAWPLAATFPALLAATLAMGMINAVVEQVNGLPIGLTYVTGALSRFGRGLGRWLLGERRDGWRVQLVPWAGMLLGAALGAWLEHHLGLQALAGSCSLACMLALVSRFIPRTWQRGYMPH